MMVKIAQLQTYTKHYSRRDEAFRESLLDRLIYTPQCKEMSRPSSLINLLLFDLYQQVLEKWSDNCVIRPSYGSSILNLPDFAKNVKNPFNFLIFRSLDLIECTARSYIRLFISVKLLRSDF